ncbi:MAG TPA: hypothetical protein VFJ90_16490, partial [Candidatus Didemnitutus sp.]|nr:hypothetical protein [Candidatus Didemnitutus sp.]
RAKLQAKDLPGAMAIYEDVLASAGARPDVLVTISGDLGVNGHLQQIAELVAPRYDAEKHGPATGLNLLQAYLALRNIDAAQHLLDILFSLQRPELEQRLFGFSNALAELMASENQAAGQLENLPAEAIKISMVSISKPVWFYGLESVAPQLLPRKEGKLRRVAFAQCVTPDVTNALERSAKPEDALGRLTRGIPLWFAETFSCSANYDSIAVIGTTNHKHFAMFPMEWVAENIRQVNETTEGGLDYVVTFALRHRNDDFQLGVRIWEVKKFRELKTFLTRWTPATANEELLKFQTLLRGYMEWTARAEGDGLAYTPSAAALPYIMSLGASLNLFLGEKNVLAPEHVVATAADFLPGAQDTRGHLALVTGLQRLQARGIAPDEAALAHARAWLASDEAKAVGVSGVQL